MMRRQQKPITIRSDRAHQQLQLLTRGGRSQAAVVEAALDGLALAELPDDLAARLARIADIQENFRREDRRFHSMAEFDAIEFDAGGNPR